MRFFLPVFIGLSLFINSPSLYGEIPDKRNQENTTDRYIIIHAGSLLGVPGKKPLHKQTILIKNNLIEDIREGYFDVRKFNIQQATIINLKNAFILPGLMDMHVHLTMDDHKKTEGGNNEDAQIITGLKNARKTIWAGFTTVRDVGAEGRAIFVLKDAINAGEFPGPRILAAGNILRVNTDDKHPGACYNVDSCRKAVRYQVNMGADWIKIYATCSGSKPCGREKAPPLLLDDELKAIIETARTREVKVAAHAHSTAGINSALRVGVSSIEHGSYNDEESHRLFIKHKAFLVPTLAVEDNIERDFKTASEPMKGIMKAFMNNHPSRTFAAYKAGVMIAAGSDAGVTPHGHNARELEWYVKIGFSEEEALITATRNAAQLIGQTQWLGTVEKGKFADIIAVRHSPLKDIHNLRNVIFVMRSGQIIRQD